MLNLEPLAAWSPTHGDSVPQWPPTVGRLGLVLFLGFGRDLVRCSSGGASSDGVGGAGRFEEVGHGPPNGAAAAGGGEACGRSSTWMGTSSRALSRSNSISG